ncbi:hypothetical protein [Dongia sedimenti]|uniref:Uncharacterized protein n=1 Tax=Dongia sedimenti TaxID=3064282 RepID=A0ABU0YTM3_9PROT|nr:hypothetical protein [Rhodospirillaceae bacterium R-7]
MPPIAERDWSFEKIRDRDEARAARLESAESPDELIESLSASLTQACDSGAVRLAIDSKNNAFIEQRAIIQFHVEPELYDWFFNARTGYRAQFWIAPDNGQRFNERIIERVSAVVNEHLPLTVTARKIEVRHVDGSREDSDCGTIALPRDQLLNSLVPYASKIWICERLCDPAGGHVQDIGLPVLSGAERSPEKLAIPRWAEAVNPKTGETGEGLRSPLAAPEHSWLDVKGGFLNAEGNPGQIKPQNDRAGQIHFIGWT